MLLILRFFKRNRPEPTLHEASYAGELAAVKKRLADGSLVEERGRQGAPALMLAAQEGHIDVVDVLLDADAQPNARNPLGVTPVGAAAYAGQALEDAPGDKDICLQQFCMERGRARKHDQLGKAAKKLYVRDHPGYEFPKKDVYCNGQLIPVNRWTESMRPYLERALAEL